MTFQESFDSSISIIALGAGIVMTLFSIGYALWGVRVMRQRTVPPSLRNAWQVHLTLGAVAPDNIDDDVMQSAQQQWLRSHGLLMAGTGTGLSFGTVSAFALMLALARVPFGLPSSLQQLIVLPLYGGVTAGIALASTFVFTRRGQAIADGALTSGEPSRRVSDYRSPLAMLITGLPFLAWSVATLIVAPRYVALSATVAREYGVWPTVLAVYPCALLLTAIFAEACVWVVVKSPPRIRLRDAAFAQRLNVGIVRFQTRYVYIFLLIWSMFLGEGVVDLFSPVRHAAESYDWLLWLWFALMAVAIASAMVIMSTFWAES